MSRLSLKGIRTVNLKIGTLVLVAVGMTSLAGRSSARPIDRRHFEVVGLTLFKDEVGDAERRLGHAAVTHPRGSMFPQRCYASVGNDRTALVLEDWAGTLVGFRIFRAGRETIKHCIRTATISSRISTGGGLRLGLTEGEVLKLLGTPTKKTQNTFVYREDVESSSKATEGLSEYTELELQFGNARTISIHVIHTVRD